MEIISCSTYNLSKVYIPSKLKEKPVTVLQQKCFAGHNEIRTIVFSDGVQSIGDYAFMRCKNLEEIAIPDTVTTIGICSFMDCKSLRKVKLPSDLDVLECNFFAFTSFHKNAEVVLPKNLRTIKSTAFYSAYLDKIVIPKSVTTIETGAFEHGPKAVTKLPYDKGWYFGWPCNETVFDSKGRKGKITDFVKEYRGYIVLSIEFENEAVSAFFPFVSGEYTFCDEKNRLLAQKYETDIYKDAEEIYEYWCNGLI